MILNFIDDCITHHCVENFCDWLREGFPFPGKSKGKCKMRENGGETIPLMSSDTECSNNPTPLAKLLGNINLCLYRETDR